MLADPAPSSLPACAAPLAGS